MTKKVIKEAHSCLVKTIQIVEKTIPKTSSETNKRPPVTWWKEECEREEQTVRSVYRKHQRDPTNTTKLRSLQYKKAIKQRVLRKVKRIHGTSS